MFDALDTGASGLTAQRIRMESISANILNVDTTHNAAGAKDPYKRRFVILAEGQAGDSSKPGVHVEQIGLDQSSPIRKYEPGHPDADAKGYVNYPNIEPAIEYGNAIEASRAYEANVTMMEVTKSMISASLRLIA